MPKRRILLQIFTGEFGALILCRQFISRSLWRIRFG